MTDSTFRYPSHLQRGKVSSAESRMARTATVPSVMPLHAKYSATTDAVSNIVAMNEPSTFIDDPCKVQYQKALYVLALCMASIPDI